MNLVPNPNAYSRLVVLAPPKARIPCSFGGVLISSDHHQRLLFGAQRLRAKVYVEDGAIRGSQVSQEGRYLNPADESAWHLLSLNEDGEVCGCSRYIAHPNTVQFAQLGIRKAALARSKEWGLTLRAAIDAEVAEARRRDLAYVEVGGWALDSSVRRTAEGVRIALATYSLARVLGGCIGITTATRRHCSATILRKIGGQPMRIDKFEIPPYYDPQYDCDMELLRFDSTEPNPRFESCIEDLRSHLTTAALVVQPDVRLEDRPQEPAVRHALAMHESHQPPVWSRGAWRLGKALAHAVQ
jgi:hypothetical protein